jgi:hypothetical protein
MNLRSPDREAIEAEIDRVRSLGLDELRTLWRTTLRSSPPPALTKDLMARLICWHIQEQAFGGLDPDTAKLLNGLARGNKLGGDGHRRLKPGTVLVREYQGERHTVTVVPGGFVGARPPTRAFPSSPAPLQERPGMARASSACVPPAMIWAKARASRPRPMRQLPKLAARVGTVATAPLGIRRCNDEDTRTEGLSLRDLYAQVDRT